MSGALLLQLEGKLGALLDEIAVYLDAGFDVPPDLVEIAHRVTFDTEAQRRDLAHAVRVLGASERFYEAEIERNQALLASQRKRIAWVERLALASLEARDVHVLNGDGYRFTRNQNPPHVEVDVPAESLPEEFRRVVPETVEADKAKLAKVLKAGGQVDGARLVEGAWRVKIT